MLGSARMMGTSLAKGVSLAGGTVDIRGTFLLTTGTVKGKFWPPFIGHRSDLKYERPIIRGRVLIKLGARVSAVFTSGQFTTNKHGP